MTPNPSDIDTLERPDVEPALDAVARRRTTLVTRLVLLVCLVFFPLPLLGQFTSVLDGVAFGGLTWAWVYAFFQFPFSLLVSAVYASRVARLDHALAASTGKDR